MSEYQRVFGSKAPMDDSLKKGPDGQWWFHRVPIGTFMQTHFGLICRGDEYMPGYAPTIRGRVLLLREADRDGFLDRAALGEFGDEYVTRAKAMQAVREVDYQNIAESDRELLEYHRMKREELDEAYRAHEAKEAALLKQHHRRR